MPTEHNCSLFCGCLRYSVVKHQATNPAPGPERIPTAPGMPARMAYPAAEGVACLRLGVDPTRGVHTHQDSRQDLPDTFGLPGPSVPIKTAKDTGTDFQTPMLFIEAAAAANAANYAVPLRPMVSRNGKQVAGVSARLAGPPTYGTAGNGDSSEDAADDSDDICGEAVDVKYSRDSFTSSVATSSSVANQPKRFSAKEVDFLTTMGGYNFVQFAGDKKFPN